MGTSTLTEREELLVALAYASASRLSALQRGKSSHRIDDYIDELLDRLSLLEVDDLGQGQFSSGVHRGVLGQETASH